LGIVERNRRWGSIGFHTQAFVAQDIDCLWEWQWMANL
jgi:hypothetical protein